MNPNFLRGICLTGALSFAFTSSAVLPAPNSPLANVDKRRTAAVPVAVQSPAKEHGRAVLESRVPGVSISTDRVSGAARWVSATHGFLTGPQGQGGAVSASFLNSVGIADPHRVIKAFLNEHAAVFGHDASALGSANLARDYVTGHNGLRTSVWEQTQDGIPVFEGLLVAHLTAKGELVSVTDHFVSDPSNSARAGSPGHLAFVSKPRLSARAAVTTAAGNIGSSIPESEIFISNTEQGASRRQTLQTTGLTGPVYAQLVWFPLNSDTLRLSWQVVLNGRPNPDRYLIVVDAETGEILLRYSLTEHRVSASYNVYTSDSPSPFSPGWPAPNSAQPSATGRVLVTDSALDRNASPAGWVNDATLTTTGNNADAFLDRNFDFQPDLPRPQALTSSNVFNFPLDLTQNPLSYQQASSVQLFYRANWFHDRLYQLGFTEAAGNYQTTNFNRGGLGNDAVVCLVQAGADAGYADNAAFQPAPDGTPGYCFMFVFDQSNPFRDGSLDQEIVCHELAHGVSSRLLGHGTLISQLQSEGMGEGWSDFYALCLLSEAGDDVNGTYAMAAYSTANFFGEQDNYYFGIRRYPYTTDLTRNPLTFKDIDPGQASSHIGIPLNSVIGGSPADEVHNQGEVWCVTLREVWASLVTKYGWQKGNELVLQLVTDGLSLAPANATFLEARDAILLADAVDTGGADYVEIWTAFAKRGMGLSATCPDSTTTAGLVESFDLPVDIGTGPADGLLEVSVTPAPGTVLFAGDTNRIFVHVRDTLAVTNASVTATMSGASLTFHDDGVSPDFAAADGTYSSQFIVPAVSGSITVSLAINAPGKSNATLSVSYATILPPSNDLFANATKVPGAGTQYHTSNARASLEPGEPNHANDASAAASLWWSYAPPASGTVLVDSGGSEVSTVVAVYTGNTIAGLQPVAASTGSASSTGRKGAYVFFQGQAGIPYRVALASVDRNSLGAVSMNIGLGLVPDTNAPTVTVTSPQSGTPAANARLQVSGSAVDPQPNASGIRQINLAVTPNTVVGDTETTTAYLSSSLDGPLSSNWTTTVTLRPGINTVTARALDHAGNASLPFSIQVSYRPLDPPNDFFVDPAALTGTSGVLADNTLNATKEIGEPNHGGIAGGKSAWWSFTAPEDGVLHLSTTNSTFDTVLAVYTGNSFTNLVPIGSNDDAFQGAPGGFSELFQAVRANVTYRIAVDGYGGTGGAMFLTYDFNPAQLFLVSASASGHGTVSPSQLYVQSNGVVSLTAVAADGYAFDSWRGGVVALQNPLTFTVVGDLSVTANFVSAAPTDGFESGTFQALTWKQVGNVPWAIVTNITASGTFAARSGAVANNQYSSLVLTTNFGPGQGTFSYRVSSEANWATLSFYLDGVLLQRWSGEVPWSTYAFPVTLGNHSLEWRYSKSLADTIGLDAAFIDNVSLPLLLPFDGSTRPSLRFGQQSDGLLFLTVFGQTNQIYTVQTSTDLRNWTELTTAAAINGYLRVNDPSGFTNSLQFYRALAP